MPQEGSIEAAKGKFGVPPEHVLTETSHDTLRTLGEREVWTYEERDASGATVALYEEWRHVTDPHLRPTTGWRKLRPDGTPFEPVDLRYGE